jgi:hypothetical protein
MTRAKSGALLLSIWCGFQVLLASGIVIAMILGGRHAPALSILFEDREIGAIDPRALATIDGLAILCNSVIAALCALALGVIWGGVIARARRAWWMLAATLGPVQASGFASDACFGHRDLIANLVSTAILAAALLLLRDQSNGSRSPSLPA